MISKIFRGIVLAMLVVCFSASAFSQLSRPVLSVSEFGATPSATNNHEAFKAAVDAAKAAAGPVEIRFEPNAVYRIGLPDGPRLQSKYALHIRGVTNLVLNGQGATLLITNPEIGAVCTENCRGVEVKNFKVDYDPLPYAQGIIHAVNLEESWFELNVDEGFLEPDQPCFERAMSKWGLTVRELADGGRQYGPAALFSKHWKKTGDRIWRFYTKENGYDPALHQAGLNVGEHFIHMARNYAQAVAAKNCDQILWENLTIYASPGLAFYPRGTSHHTIRDCHVRVKAGRIFSTDADGIHMRGSRGNVLIDGCSFEGMADDAINVHSSALSIQAQPAPNQVVVKKHTYSVRPGDRLQLVHSDSATRGITATVLAVEELGASWRLTFDQAIPSLSSGDHFDTSDNFYNLSEAADPFVIRNCRFNDYRGRGILVSARGGLIEKNVFKVRQGWSVVMNYESTRWAEGPIASDLVVRDNEFHGYGAFSAAILTHRTARNGSRLASRPFHNIRIEDNRFYDYGTPVLELNDARDVLFRSNRVVCAETAPRGRPRYASVVLKNCAEVIIDTLDVSDTDSRQFAVVEIDAQCESGESIAVEAVTAHVAGGCKQVVDRRVQ